MGSLWYLHLLVVSVVGIEIDPPPLLSFLDFALYVAALLKLQYGSPLLLSSHSLFYALLRAFSMAVLHLHSLA